MYDHYDKVCHDDRKRINRSVIIPRATYTLDHPTGSDHSCQGSLTHGGHSRSALAPLPKQFGWLSAKTVFHFWFFLGNRLRSPGWTSCFQSNWKQCFYITSPHSKHLRLLVQRKATKSISIGCFSFRASAVVMFLHVFWQLVNCLLD